MQTNNKFIKFIKSFTLYQKLYLLLVIGLVIVFCVFLPDEILEDTSNNFVVICSVVAVLANPVCELLISKQSKWNFIVSIIFIEITESILYFSLGYFSTALISILFWIPIDLLSFFNWNKNPDKKEEILTKVKKLSPIQDIFMVLAILCFGFGVGFILTLIPGAEDTYLDAFTSAIGMANGILLLMRYNEQWYAWFLTLMFEAILYIISGSFIMLISVAAMMINTIYGFVKWVKYIKSRQILNN